MDNPKQSGNPNKGSHPLAVLGAYGPAVLRCGYQRTEKADELVISCPNSYRMIGVRDGTVVLTEGASRPSACTPGSVVLLKPGGEYHLELAPGAHLIRLTFDVVYQPRQGHPGEMTHIRPARRQPSPTEVWGVDLPTRIPEVLASQCMMAMELIRNEHWQRPAVYARTCGRLGLLLGELVSEASAPPVSAGPARGYWATRVERLMRDRQSTLPTVAQLAAAVGVSREHLSRSYRQETGVTLSGRLKEERWRRAADMLANTHAPINAIARRVGYRRAESFAQAFRQARGMTPTAFRRRADLGM
jgi:AraC-like DNA-binding protein